jgi:hypothetical protein
MWKPNEANHEDKSFARNNKLALVKTSIDSSIVCIGEIKFNDQREGVFWLNS